MKPILFLIISISILACNPGRVYRTPEAAQLEASDYQKKLKLTQQKNIVDVRFGSEFGKHRIADARHASYIMGGFSRKVDSLDRETPIFIYCETAHRSPYAAKRLRKMGFKEIYDLEKGMKNWRKKGFPYLSEATTPKP